MFNRRVGEFINKYYIYDDFGNEVECCNSYCQAEMDKWEYGDNCTIIYEKIWVDKEKKYFFNKNWDKDYFLKNLTKQAK